MWLCLSSYNSPDLPCKVTSLCDRYKSPILLTGSGQQILRLARVTKIDCCLPQVFFGSKLLRGKCVFPVADSSCASLQRVFHAAYCQIICDLTQDLDPNPLHWRERWLVGGFTWIWVRQLGLLFPTEWTSTSHVPVTTNQIPIYNISSLSSIYNPCRPYIIHINHGAFEEKTCGWVKALLTWRWFRARWLQWSVRGHAYPLVLTDIAIENCHVLLIYQL